MIQYPTHQIEPKRLIISLGGSLIVPDEIDVEYLKQFRQFILQYLDEGWSFLIVTGGGAQARNYINAATDVLDNDLTNDDKDWLGIHATRFNGHLLRTIFCKQAQAAIITDPEKDKIDLSKSIVVASGWKPGWSTDFVANKLAQRYHAPMIMNLSNIKQVYDADPKQNPQAKPIEKMLWKDFRAMVGDEWLPGMNTPYDPIAAKLADQENTKVMVIEGGNFANLHKAFRGEPFVGTMLYNR